MYVINFQAEQSVVDAIAVLRTCLAPAVKTVISETPDSMLTVGSIHSGTEGTVLLSLIDDISGIVFVSATAMEHGEYDFDGTKPAKVRFFN